MSWPQTSDSKSFAQFILKDPFSLIFQVKQNLIQCCLFLPFCLNVHLLGSWGKGWFSNSCLEAINEFDLEKNWKPVGCTTSSNLLLKIYLLTVSSDACILICPCPGEALSSSTYSFSKHSLHYASNETLSLSRARSRDICYSFRIFPFKLASLDHLLRSSTLKLSWVLLSSAIGCILTFAAHLLSVSSASQQSVSGHGPPSSQGLCLTFNIFYLLIHYRDTLENPCSPFATFASAAILDMCFFL